MFTLYAPVHLGLLDHPCGGQSSCSIAGHVDCPEGLMEAVLPAGSLEAYRDMSGEELLGLTKRFEGSVVFNNSRGSLQLFDCADPTAVVVNLPLSDEQLRQVADALGPVDPVP